MLNVLFNGSNIGNMTNSRIHKKYIYMLELFTFFSSVQMFLPFFFMYSHNSRSMTISNTFVKHPLKVEFNWSGFFMDILNKRSPRDDLKLAYIISTLVGTILIILCNTTYILVFSNMLILMHKRQEDSSSSNGRSRNCSQNRACSLLFLGNISNCQEIYSIS